MAVRLGSLLRAAVVLVLIGAGAGARAAEHVTLRNGFELDCAREEVQGDRVRLYLVPTAGASAQPGDASYIEVGAAEIVRTEVLADAPAAVAARAVTAVAPVQAGPLTGEEMRQMLAAAGIEHNIDADLLASVVHAESGGRAHAVSRAGAQGLMQLMPGTAAEVGVTDAFAPKQNIRGGTVYLDQLLTRYHDNMAWALAAYNAGPAAVDRYHGIPPYTETRAYVARVIREFNRRKAAQASELASAKTAVR